METTRSTVTHETVDDIIRKLMEIDTKLDAILEYLGLTDDEPEEDDS